MKYNFPRHGAPMQLVLFCLVGASGVGVNSMVMLALFRWLGSPYLLASCGAFVVANINNYIWNKYLTFKDGNWKLGTVFWQYVRYLIVSLLGLVVNLGVLSFLVEVMGQDPVLANLAGVLIGTVFNFLGSKYFAFGTFPTRLDKARPAQGTSGQA